MGVRNDANISRQVALVTLGVIIQKIYDWFQLFLETRLCLKVEEALGRGGRYEVAVEIRLR